MSAAVSTDNARAREKKCKADSKKTSSVKAPSIDTCIPRLYGVRGPGAISTHPICDKQENASMGTVAANLQPVPSYTRAHVPGTVFDKRAL